MNLKSARSIWFEVWGTEVAQNKVLKGLLLGALALILILSTTTTILSVRKPVVIAVSSEETKLLEGKVPSDLIIQAEVKRVISGYLLNHYNVSPGTIDEAYSKAAKYVSDAFVKSFLSSNVAQIKIVKEKNLNQKLFVTDIQVDLKNEKAKVSAEKILILGELRSATSLQLEVGFTLGARTSQNLEGVYVTSETLLSKSINN